MSYGAGVNVGDGIETAIGAGVGAGGGLTISALVIFRDLVALPFRNSEHIALFPCLSELWGY